MQGAISQLAYVDFIYFLILSFSFLLSHNLSLGPKRMPSQCSDQEYQTLRSESQTVVGINAWVANFNKDVFGADAMIFRPERWLDSSPTQLAEMDNYFLTVFMPNPFFISYPRVASKSVKNALILSITTVR